MQFQIQIQNAKENLGRRGDRQVPLFLVWLLQYFLQLLSIPPCPMIIITRHHHSQQRRWDCTQVVIRKHTSFDLVSYKSKTPRKLFVKGNCIQLKINLWRWTREIERGKRRAYQWRRLHGSAVCEARSLVHGIVNCFGYLNKYIDFSLRDVLLIARIDLDRGLVNQVVRLPGQCAHQQSSTICVGGRPESEMAIFARRTD